MQSGLSRGEQITDEGRAVGSRNMTKRNRNKRMGTGPDSAGQGGATQQISDTPIADSESVEELAEEGNAFEANAIYGVENARDPSVSELITHEIPEDDVPGEYLDSDERLA
jgi:N utilization substance protein A